jgi:glutamate-1-semialdehyde 2,1-aminomutase
LLAQARSAGIEVTYSGPPAIPYMTFKADAGHFDRAKVFAGACSRSGVYIAPRHNWFISAAHTDRDIEQTLNVTEQAFAAVRKQFGA